ncbi:general substrate transporter [Dunaliella salina]|uniref:General substrate transporter n=1 Tax=Dunaliella salina TaxID=3046 RepID=A0ABQ7GGA3_DUNSA|nr:general substrate transporter [Dunaliella salina]|eukprot:KAF5833592.1 general substrate transporter [Dunaliella salina]
MRVASWTLAAVASFSALGGFIFGYDLGLIGGALLGLSVDLGIHDSISQSSIVGALKLGSFVGAFVGGALMLRYGRRKAIAMCSLFAMLGPLVMASSSGVGGLVAGRAISGIGVGACAIIVPAYLAEVAPASHRGAVVQVYEMMLCVGLLVSTLVNWGLSHLGPFAWRVMVGLPAIPGGLLAGSLLLLPESPRWLVMQGHLDLALQTIHTVLGGKKSPFPGVFGQDPAEIAQAEDELLLLC